MKKILITGASGFIGQHLAEELLNKEFEVYLFDIQKNASSSIHGEFIKGDITDLKQVVAACRDVDGIIHLAAISRVSLASKFPYDCINVNIMGTANILESIRLSKINPWLIMVSSREVNFDLQNEEMNNSFIRANNLYGISKFIGELLCSQYTKNYNLRTLILRFSDVYGSIRDNPEKIIPKLITRSLNNNDIVIDNPDKQFDFVHYKDIMSGIYLSIEYLNKNIGHPLFKQIVLCTGRTISLKKLVELIIKGTNSSSKIMYKSSVLNKVSDEIFTDIKGAEKLLGFKAKIPIEEGIKGMIQNLKKNKISNM